MSCNLPPEDATNALDKSPQLPHSSIWLSQWMSNVFTSSDVDLILKEQIFLEVSNG